MVYFLKKLLKFILFYLAFLMVGITAFVFVFEICSRNIPPPEISDSYSFNDKLRFSRGKKADAVIIGSSMSLNNLYSPFFAREYRSLLNLSSWGLSLGDTYEVLKAYASFHKPKTLIICSNVLDFNQTKKNYDPEELADYYKTDYPFYYHVRHFSLKYYLEFSRYSKKVKSGRNFYESLVYDPYGTVNFEPKNFEIDSTRWDSHYITRISNNTNYDYLDSVSAYCRKNNIQLLFCQSPVRKGLMNEPVREILNEHTSRIRGILKRHNYDLVNANERQWNDEMFVDGIHLNVEGAKTLSGYFLENKIKEQGD